MRIGLLADIHCNVHALEAVLADASAIDVDEFVLLGDLFGYLPWAVETYRMIRRCRLVAAIRGNHDELVLSQGGTEAAGDYRDLARQNWASLRDAQPDALGWLAPLPFHAEPVIAGRELLLCHGTPADPQQGRYYPDDQAAHAWLPQPGEVLVLGHTHYPLARLLPGGGRVLNPGSVGQPRDGNPMPSWGVLDWPSGSFKVRRPPYDLANVVAALRRMAWDERSIAALQKSYPGPLRFPASPISGLPSPAVAADSAGRGACQTAPPARGAGRRRAP